jgi:hypothetical protein
MTAQWPTPAHSSCERQGERQTPSTQEKPAARSHSSLSEHAEKRPVSVEQTEASVPSSKLQTAHTSEGAQSFLLTHEGRHLSPTQYSPSEHAAAQPSARQRLSLQCSSARQSASVSHSEASEEEQAG